MYSTIELKAFELIDKFLKRLVEEGSGSVWNLDNNFHSDISQYAYQIICEKELISFRVGYKDESSIVDISTNGLNILKLGGYKNYLDAVKKQFDHDQYVKSLEIEKTKTDLELAKKMLKDYPMTKWIARISFIIALCLAVLELIKFLNS